jgi:hypothetical protein
MAMKTHSLLGAHRLLLVALVAASAAISGCAVTVPINRGDSSAAGKIEQLNRWGGIPSATLLLATGERLQIGRFEIHNDSIHWRNSASRITGQAALSDVREVVRHRRRTGATVGGLVGLPIGVLVGGKLGERILPAGSGFVHDGAIMGALTGIFVGPVLGAALGSNIMRSTYKFDYPPSASGELRVDQTTPR